MAIASMTGFARVAGGAGPYRWVWELKTVNARGLDIRLRVPTGYEAAGEDVRQAIGKAIRRGSCQVALNVSVSETGARVRVNTAAAQAILEALAKLDVPDGVGPLTLDGLLSVRGVVETVDIDEETSADITAELTRDAMQAVAALAAARGAEGSALLSLLEGQLARIRELAQAADQCPARRPEAIRTKLAEQVAALTEASTTLDPQRLHQEAVLLATKADVREEIDRLVTHVAAARALLAEGGAVGRRLDFLAQEFSREANTLCAKANDVSLSAIGLELKSVVEQFREQVQNVE
ncbi:YicC/YloC family endoribonuclease [Chelatococcus reniformis]|nr:YicC/YloC family endoribonuclease [Chelatococcus reniformis]